METPLKILVYIYIYVCMIISVCVHVFINKNICVCMYYIRFDRFCDVIVMSAAVQKLKKCPTFWIRSSCILSVGPAYNQTKSKKMTIQTNALALTI